MTSDPLKAPLPAPKRPTIPGYEISEVIGRGATGTVYRARQRAVDREVAVKVLHAELSAEPRLVTRLQREARTTARLAHPHVVSAIDMGQTAGQWWYAMEFVDGPSLALRLRQEGRLREREALRHFIPLCEALEHLWEHGVVHRDIKPANILIDRAGGARLADLGLAFADDDPKVTKQGGTLGTPHYISPEQTVDPSAADVRSDIWSFGATLFHSVCGRTPFSGDSAAEILSNVLYARIPDPRELEPSLSKGLALVLRKCLTREPEGRYQTPHELLLDLERVRERRQPKVRRAALDPVEHPGRAWRPWLIVAGIVVIGTAAPFLLLQQLESPARASESDTALVPRFEPLEELYDQALRAPTLLAQYRGELADLERSVPAANLPRWKEIDDELSALLRRRVQAVVTGVRAEVTRLMDARDYRAAQTLLDVEFPERVFAKTGYRSDQLELEGASAVGPQLEQIQNDIDARAGAAADELSKALSKWSERTRADVERLLESQEWNEARALLVEAPDEILTAAGLAGFSLPDALLELTVLEVQDDMRVNRRHIRNLWETEDLDLKQWVQTRTRRLRDELESGPPRPRSADDLARLFALELESRRLTRAKMPTDLPRTGLKLYEESHAELVELEQALLESDARTDFEEATSLCAPYWGSREYEEAGRLWQEALDRFVALSDRAMGEWRAELMRRAALRREEARLLERLLRRASNRIRDLHGQVYAFTVRGIGYERRVAAGDDPLSSGFRLEGLRDRLSVRELASEKLEELAGLSAEDSLVPADRLTLALFRFYEGRYEEAYSTLRNGALPTEGRLSEIEPELLDRVFDSMEHERAEETQRERDAIDLLARIDGKSEERSPSAVKARVEKLLREYADLPMVRERMPALRAQRDRLREETSLTDEERILKLFGPDEISFPYKRVRMAWDFDSRSEGGWQHGEWVFDTPGWVREDKVEQWDQLRDQRGPRLFLNPPVDASSPLEVEIIIEQSFEGPPKLVLVSVGGFHAALCGAGLPGPERGARFLLGTEDFEDFVERLRAGEGTPDDSLLQHGKTHALVLRAYRPSGKLTLELDGRVLDEIQRLAPRSEAPRIEIRSWEPVHLKRVVVEAGR